jgi:benzil reductase ((S)-benzoin forming)
MHYIYITGSSRGIGKAMVDLLLQRPDTYVIGLARNRIAPHERFKQIRIDLSSAEQIADFEFVNLPETESVHLINNAGSLGKVGPVGRLDGADLLTTFLLNTGAAVQLSNAFLSAYQYVSIPKSIIHISSGAARKPVEGWSTYCTTKAALDMHAQVLDAEQRRLPKQNRVKIFSVAPGVVDTKMQGEIRELSPDIFPDVNRFLLLKTDGLLFSPDEAAKRLVKIIDYPEEFEDVLLDVRNF